MTQAFLAKGEKEKERERNRGGKRGKKPAVHTRRREKKRRRDIRPICPIYY